MTLDPKWYGTGPSDPFRDGQSKTIVALTMRQFASDIAAQVASPGMVFRGAYNGATTYNPNDVVTLSGSSYILAGVSTSTGVSPPGGNWQVLAAKGDPGAGVTFGTTAGTATEGNDTRVVNAVQTSRQVIAGTGLTGGGTLAADRTFAVAYGTSGTTACAGNDARLSDQRTPLDNSVTSAKIVNGTIVAADIANGTITGTQLASGAVGLVNMANVPASTILGNASFFGAAPAALGLVTVADMLDGVMQASQVAVDSTGGLVGPKVQTALQGLYDSLVIALDPVFE